MKKYVVITWPWVQDLFEVEGFYEHSYLVNDDQGIEDFGSSAYFVEEEWLNALNEIELARYKIEYPYED